MFGQYYAHKTIRLYTAVFGTLFNEMKVEKAGNMIKVPLQYRGGNKSVIRNSDDSLDGELVSGITLPIASFALIGWERDPNRQMNKLNRIREDLGTAQKTTGVVQSQYNRVPYNFQYELSVKTKTIDELFQICEQVLANFDPHIDVTVKDNPDLSQDSSIRVRLENSVFEDSYEGPFEEPEIHECTFTFMVEGWLYKRTNGGSIIKQVDVEFHKLISLDDEWTDEHITETE